EAGNRAGCRTILVDLGTEPPPERSLRRPDFVARDTLHALQIITTLVGLSSWSADLSHATTGSPALAPDLAYRPPRWPPVSAPAGLEPVPLPTSYCLLQGRMQYAPTGGRHGRGS